jgi:molybdopterin synthase catalytic subunit
MADADLDFTLLEEPLDGTAVNRNNELIARHPETGGIVIFDGRVRNHHRGRGVDHLEYAIYADLAQHEGARIVAQAAEQFELDYAHVIHRTGHLDVGEMAVWVCVGAAHREAAFAACRWIIDEVKRDVPIWKHEFYTDGTSEWVLAGQ